jgi:hypothetical protein
MSNELTTIAAVIVTIAVLYFQYRREHDVR